MRLPAANAPKFHLCGSTEASACPPPSQRPAWTDRKARGVVLIESENIMNQSNPGTTFRGLPLTAEQDSEIRHYIHTKERSREQWDTPELRAMLADMLNPPEVVDDDIRPGDASMAAERATAQGEESLDTDRLRAHGGE